MAWCWCHLRAPTPLELLKRDGHLQRPVSALPIAGNIDGAYRRRHRRRSADRQPVCTGIIKPEPRGGRLLQLYQRTAAAQVACFDAARSRK
jgi:hypothetical protein